MCHGDVYRRCGQVERRSEGNVVDLLNELKEGSTANTDALNQGFSLIASLLAAAANDTKKAQAEAQASVGQDPLLSEQIYWLALEQATVSTNEAAIKLNFVGIGFEAYFNPLFPSFFKCTYTDAKNNKVGTRHDALADSPHPPSALGWAGCLWRVAWHGELRTWMPGRERGHGCGASGKVPGGMASRLRRTCCEPRRCAPCRVRGGRKGR